MGTTIDRLNVWCHWKRLEEDVGGDMLLMVSDIEKVLDVVEAAHAIVDLHNIDATCKNCTGHTNHVEQLLENLKRLEETE